MENTIITLNLEDGTEMQMSLFQIFKAGNGQEYAALFPLDESSPRPAELEEEVPYMLLRAIPKDDDYSLESIDDEQEYDVADEAFIQILNDIALEEASPSDIDSEAIVTIDGEEYVIDDIFEARGRQYAALEKLSERFAAPENRCFHLFRYEERVVDDDNMDISLSQIRGDMEYADVEAAFNERLAAAMEVNALEEAES